MNWLNAIVALLNKWGAAFGAWLLGKQSEQLKQAKRDQEARDAQDEKDTEYERRRTDPAERDRVSDAIKRAADD